MRSGTRHPGGIGQGPPPPVRPGAEFVRLEPNEHQQPWQLPGTVAAPPPTGLINTPSLGGVATSRVQTSGVIDARALSGFLAELPPSQMSPWHRVASARGSTFLATTGVKVLAIDKLPKTMSLIILSMRQYWLEAALDPADPDALFAADDLYVANGKVSFNLQVNNNTLFNAHEQCIDPNGGLFTPRSVAGYTVLNRNILEMGIHPTAVYAREASNLIGTWTVNAVPPRFPQVVQVALDGYLIQTTMMNRLLTAVSVQHR